MAEIKWIKITTDIFDDDKIKIIDKYPARDEILVIWFKILALAGKTNQSGLLFMSNRIPYTTEMLAAVFNREENSVKMALSTFEKFGMIHIEENEIIAISNWEKHQNVDGMDKIKEQNRLRAKNYRESQKLLAESNVTDNVTDNVTVTQSNAIEEDKEKRIKTKKKIEDIHIAIDGLKLTEEEYLKAINEYGELEVIRKLEYMENYKGLGKKYKSLYKTLCNWLKSDYQKGITYGNSGKQNFGNNGRSTGNEGKFDFMDKDVNFV